MRSLGACTGRLSLRFMLVALLLGPMAALGACSSASSTAPSTVVHAKQTTTVTLKNGADLIIPPGAMTDGATVQAQYVGKPSGAWGDSKPIAPAVELISNPPNAIHGLLTLEFPVPAAPDGSDPATLYGISTFVPTTHQWTPVLTSYDQARHMVVALIPHFSWYNPTTWDWAGIGAHVNQAVGQLVGKRASPPTCTSGPPSWVASVTVQSDPAVAVFSCAQSQGDILDVEMVNNRPYGMVLTYGGPVKWGWHEPGNSVQSQLLNQLADTLMKPNELYLPPLGHASVGIFPLKSGALAQFVIGPSRASLLIDFINDAASYLLGKIKGVGGCASFGAGYVTDLSPGSIRDNMVSMGDCLLDEVKAEAASGALDTMTVDELESQVSGLEKASVVGTAWYLYGIEWQLADLYVDHYVVGDSGGIGAGFVVLAHNNFTQPPAPPTPAPPTPVPPTPPTPVTPVPHNPVNAYNNYGSSNVVGRAMCRGNPGNSLSMPGGTASQTFSVPSGVGTLSSALVQIDPDSTVTAHLSLAVNGNVVATTSAAAAGDTHFTFGPVAVSPGDAVTLSITFTATYGKIITVYTVGAPGGTFTASNSCPDGAPSLTTTSTGLRAVVSGLS